MEGAKLVIFFLNFHKDTLSRSTKTVTELSINRVSQPNLILAITTY